jgi:hypothetical protein
LYMAATPFGLLVQWKDALIQDEWGYC